LSVPPARCLVFEDSATGVRAAREAGMKVVAISSSGQNFDSISHAPHAIFPSLAVFRDTHFVTGDAAHGKLLGGPGEDCQPSPNKPRERMRGR